MKLPWSGDNEKDEELERLSSKIEELEEEVKRYRKRFEAEKERRSKLSRQKQEAEEELNILEQKMEASSESVEAEKDEAENSFETFLLELDYFEKLVSRFQTIESEEKELVTVYSTDKLAKHHSINEVKNSLPSEKISSVLDRDQILVLSDGQQIHYVFSLRPFYQDYFEIDNRFNLESILEFIEREKYWVLVELGHTKILKEEAGDYEVLEEVKSRVDRKHSKGGFSQQRFERKRKEQVSQHLEQVEEALPEGEVYLLGDNRYCQELSGKYLGSFDSSNSIKQELYRPQIHK